jgi:hypothetical protein
VNKKNAGLETFLRRFEAAGFEGQTGTEAGLVKKSARNEATGCCRMKGESRVCQEKTKRRIFYHEPR